MEENFPNLFTHLPSKYGDGFFGGFDDSFSVTPTSAKIERVVPTTYKPRYSPTPPASYNSPTSPSYYERKQNSYDRYSVDQKPPRQTKKDIEISNSGNSGLAVVPSSSSSSSSGRQTTARPHLYSPSPYAFYTPRSKTKAPYEFYSPTTTPSSRLDLSYPESGSLHPADNFPALFKKPERKQHSPPPPPSHRRPQSPLQSFLNPFRSIFSLGGGNTRHQPGQRRQYSQGQGRPYSLDEVSAVPEPLPPPEGFPQFKYSLSRDEISDDVSEDYEADMRRRRRKHPRRPLFDGNVKLNMEKKKKNFQDLMAAKQFAKPERRPTLFRRGPQRQRYPDMDYSPSDKEETLTTALTTALTTQPIKTVKTTVRAKPKKQSSLEIGVFNPGN